MSTQATVEQQTQLLWQHLKSFHAVHVVNVGAKLGLFAALRAKPDQTTAELAAPAGLHLPYVTAWARIAHACELLDGDDGPPQRFRLAPSMDQLLAEPGGMRNLAPYFTAAVDFLHADMAAYPEYFRTGATYTFQDHGEAFSAAIGQITAGFHPLVARRLLPSLPGMKEKLAEGAAILDMGCGTGNLLLRIAEAHPKARCVGVDVDPNGVTLAQRRIALTPLSDRVSVELLDGDRIAHRDVFDVAIMFEVLHEIPVPIRPGVLANCHRALKPGGNLLIVDETFPSRLADGRDFGHLLALQTQFNELIWGNVVPTAVEQDQLLADAGFRQINRQTIGDIFTVLSAIK